MNDYGLALNPVGYWKLDEPSGALNIVDSSGNENTGSYLNGAVFEGAPLSPYSQYSISYDGSQTQNVSQISEEVMDHDLSAGDEITLECWLTPNADTFTGTASEYVSIFVRGTSSNGLGFFIYEGDLIFAVGNNSQWVTSTITLVAGTKYHLIGRARDGESELLVNLVSAGTNTSTADNAGTGNDIYLAGTWGTGNHALDCDALDMCAFYKSWLTDDEIYRLHNKLLTSSDFVSADTTIQENVREVLCALTDGVNAGELFDANFVKIVFDGLVSGDVLFYSKHKEIYSTEGLIVNNIPFRVAFDALTEGLATGESLEPIRASLIHSLGGLIVGEDLAGVREATLLIASGMLLANSVATGKVLEAIDGQIFSENHLINIHRTAELIEKVLFGDALGSNIYITALIHDGIEFSKDITLSAWLQVLHTEGLRVAAVAVIRGQAYTCFAINQESGAVSEYTGYDFSDMLNVDDDLYLGSGEGGIVALDGSTDDGDPISSVYRSGVWEAAKGYKTVIDDAFILMSGDGEAYLRTTTDDGMERTYKVKAVQDGRPRARRTMIAEGVESVTWQFELELISGDGLAFSSIRMQPVPLTRRI